MSIYGLHDLSEKGAALLRGGWLVDAVAIGHGSGGGADYRHWAPNTVICRLNNGWHPDGTIPQPSLYDAFARRCADYVRGSQGCNIWIIGNEPNLSIERPFERIISADDYALCYRKCYDAIKAVDPDAWVVPAAIGPWNIETGDWLFYYRAVLEQVEADALCWHLYTHGTDPALVTSDAPMGPPYQDRYFNFRCYKDFEAWTPPNKRGLPVLVTEANQNGPWKATGWIQAAYKEIQRSSFDVRCMCLFRAQDTGDGYGMENKPGVWDEFARVVENEEEEEPMPDDWLEIFVHRMERGSHDQGGKPEFTLPNGFTLYYLHNPDVATEYNEPETDMKDATTQSEVYEGRYSAVIMFQFSTGAAWLVGDPVYVQNGRLVRTDAMYMHVFSNAGGGARLGMTDGDGPFLQQYAFPPAQREALVSQVIWGGWVTTYDGTPQREWAKLTSPQMMPTKGYVRPVIEFASNDAGFAAGHFDVVRIEQLGGTTPEPGPEPTPGEGVDYARIRAIVRDELDSTRLGT